MKKLLNRKIIGELLCIFVLSLTPILWFKPGTILVGHDNTYPLAPQPFLANRLSTWTENFFGHDQSLILGTIPIHFLDALPSFFGISLQVGQAIVYVFWFFFIGVSAYILAWVLRPQSRIFHLTAVILYQFNYFILQGWWIGEKSKFSAYIAFPLILSLFFLVTRRRMGIFTGALFTSLILFVFNGGGLYGIPLFGGAIVGVGILFLLKACAYIQSKDFSSLRHIIRFSVLTFVFTILINAYFIIPAYAKVHAGAVPTVDSVGGVSGVISWATQISANASYLNLFRLQGIAEWYDNPEHPYAKIILERRLFIAISFLWPLLVFLSLFVIKKSKSEKIITYFFIVYLIGIFFSSGTHPPLGFLYKIFVEKIPGFVLFRSPYFKFAPAIFLASSFLISYFIDNLPRQIRTFAFFVLLFVVGMYHFPYFTGNFFAWRNIFSTRLMIPPYVYEFGTWLNQKKNDDGRVLMLPPNNPDLLYSSYRWGYLSFQALPTLSSGKSTIINNDQLNPAESTLLHNLYAAIERKDGEIIKKLSSILHVSYVLVQNDAISDPKSDIRIDVQTYGKAVRSNSQFFLLRSFEKWDLFMLRETISPELYTTDRLTAISGDNKEFNSYLGFTRDSAAFFNESDVIQSRLSNLSRLVVPTCLTCPPKERLVILFPEHNILPSDPFYQFVLFLESQRPVPKEPKPAIYHLLGNSLKRLSEINDMVIHQKKLLESAVDQYILLLESVEQKFLQLQSLQEKISVARDIGTYMRSERNLLGSNIGENIASGEQTVLAGRIFTEIQRLENQVALPELQLDELSHRVYQFSVAKESKFELLIRSSEFQAALPDEGGNFSAIIDNSIERELHVTKDMLTQPWISFGWLTISEGFHTLTLSFPPPQKKMQILTRVTTEFSHDNTVCFGTQISNLQSSKLYKLYLSYVNDFARDLFLYIWDQRGETQKLKNAIALLPSSLKEKNEQIIETSDGISDALVAVCSPDLTEEKVQKRFEMSFSDIVNPAPILYLQEQTTQNTHKVSVSKTNSARYKLNIIQDEIGSMLVFSERYDDWWELKGVKSRHLQVNGYANGWIIEGKPSGVLELTYKGEQYFFYGKLVSLLTVTSGLLYLGYHTFRSRKND